MKITITHHYNIYTLIWSIGKERKTYIQKNNCCIWAQRSDNWMDMYWIQQLLLFVTCILPAFYLYLPVLSRVHEKRAALFTPQSCVWGEGHSYPLCQTCPSIIWWHFVFFQTSVQRDKMVPYREKVTMATAENKRGMLSL